MHYHIMTAISPLSPHFLVQIGLEIFYSQTHFSILTQFKLAPGRLHFSCVHACTKLYTWTTTWCALTLGSPVKRWYAAQLSECRSVPGRRHLCIIGNRVAASPLDNLKVASCWTVFQQNYSKYPRVTGSPPFSVVLQDNNVQMLAEADATMCIYIFRKGCLYCVCM